MWFSLLSCNECSANALLVRLSRAPAWVVLCFFFSFFFKYHGPSRPRCGFAAFSLLSVPFANVPVEVVPGMP